MKLISTRQSGRAVSAAQAIVSGISPEGGLYAPESFPAVSRDELNAFSNMPYAQVAARILSLYLTDYTAQELLDMCQAAYGPDRFDCELVAPLRKVGEQFVLELFHGPTFAFKDMALQMLPRLLTAAMRKTGVDVEFVILVATSGDTGKAA